MQRCVTHPDRDSIFGNTYDGVPNPMIPFQHAYPTRYHGQILAMPQSIPEYRSNPLYRASLGEAPPPLVRSVTGYMFLDAAIGGAIGYMLAPKQDQRLMWTGIGAVGTALAGTLGLVGTTALAFSQRGR